MFEVTLLPARQKLDRGSTSLDHIRFELSADAGRGRLCGTPVGSAFIPAQLAISQSNDLMEALRLASVAFLIVTTCVVL